MAATSTTTAPAGFVVVAADGTEVHTYTQKGSANRAAGKLEGSRVVPAAEWAAEQAAAAEAVAEAERAAAAAVEAPAEAASTKRAPRVARSRAEVDDLVAALTVAQRRAITSRLHEAARGVLAELAAAQDPALEGVSHDIVEARVALWMSYMPGGKAAWSDLL